MTMFICPICDAGFDDLDSEDWPSIDAIREVNMCQSCYEGDFCNEADEGDAFSIY